jgi:hypothetical protein
MKLDIHKIDDRLEKTLSNFSDKVRKKIKCPISNFGIKKYLEFEKVFNEYHPYQVCITTIVNYLSEELLSKHSMVLTDARKYSEAVYTETEEFFEKLAEHLSNAEYPKEIILSMAERELKDFMGGNWF